MNFTTLAPALFLIPSRSVPFTDPLHPIGAQPVPGTVQCDYYDTGGEGIAYHDTDAVNHGSGELNPSDGS